MKTLNWMPFWNEFNLWMWPWITLCITGIGSGCFIFHWLLSKSEQLGNFIVIYYYLWVQC